MHLQLLTQLVTRWRLAGALLSLLLMNQAIVVGASMESQERPLIEALEELSEAYQVFFTYDNQQLSDVNVHFTLQKNEALMTAVNRLLKPTGFQFEHVEERFFVIFRDNKKGRKGVNKILKKFGQIEDIEGKMGVRFMKDANPVNVLDYAQKQTEFTVSGIVKNEEGEPLQGATVRVKGQNIGALTDAEGKFSFDIPNGTQILIISYIGYAAKEVPVNGQESLEITLATDLAYLDEVVVVGYGSQKKSDLTGAVSSIKSSDIEQVPVLGLDQALQGRASGVFVSNNNANPGGQISIRVRGTNSIQGNNEPLYVIDGYIGANINTVNPSDIESMEVLKDASATAIYGSRGANGVVIITTKQGKKGKNNISFDAFYGVQTVTKEIDLLGSREYAEVINQIRANTGNEPVFTDLNNLPESNWQDEILRTAAWQNYVLSASGGTDKLNYYLSGAYTKQEGIVEATGFERFNLRANMDSDISEKLTVGARLGFSRIDRTLQDGEEFGNVTASNHPVINSLLLPPTAAVRDAAGNLLTEVIDGEGSIREHPLFFLQNVQNESVTNFFNGNLYAELKLMDNLKVRSSFGFDIVNAKGNRYKPSFVFEQGPASNTNQADISTSFRTGWLQENYITYSPSFGGNEFQFTVGNTLQGSSTETFVNTVRDFAVDDFDYHNLSAGETINFYDSDMSEWTQASFFGRINYTLNGKYLFTFNGRYDGNSKFGDDKKWGFFPSGAIGWRLSEEEFIQSLGIFSNMKLRASYGISGSEALGPYNSLASLTSFPETYIIGGQTQVGFWSNRLPNPQLGWEETEQLDIGLDFGILDGRLNFVIDYFQKTTKDLFLNKPVPQTSGVSTILQNIGSLKNTGVEIGISAVTISSDDFRWNVSLNGTFQQSEVLDLGGQEEILLGDFQGRLKLGNIQILRVGEAFGSFYGYKTDGTWSTTDNLESYTQFGATPQPGDQKFVDVNGDGDVNAEDRQIIGQAQPKFFGGFNNTFAFKGFDLSIFMQFVTGTNVLNATSYDLLDPGSIANSKHVDIRNAWTESNQDTEIARLGSGINNVVLDRFVEDASFLRFREISFGYNFPSAVLDQIKASNLRLYFTATNLFTITDYSGYDPEVNIGGGRVDIINTDNGSYPRAKTFIFGLNLTF